MQAPPDDATPGHPLDNPAWYALTSHHAGFAEVAGRARRYPQAVSFYSAVDRLDADGWAALAAMAGPSTPLLIARTGAPEAPDGWHHLRTVLAHQMVSTDLANVPPAPVGVTVRRLGQADVGAMLDLVAATMPGPFLPSTIRLGRYLGVEDGDRLVAMAGERLHLPGYAEVSAVCTHPVARGRGLATHLSHTVARGIVARGEVPFLHVSHGNDTARRLYEQLGFVTRTTMVFTALETPAAHSPACPQPA